MIRTYAKSLLSVATAGLLVLGACGKDTSTDTMTSSSYTMALAVAHGSNNMGINSIDDAEDCGAMMDTIRDGRAKVSATDEWKAFEATDEWKQVELDGQVLRKLNCKHNDPLPSTLCTTMVQKIKDHFAAAQATDEYKACTKLQVWQDLEQSYADAREAGCLPSQQQDTGTQS